MPRIDLNALPREPGEPVKVDKTMTPALEARFRQAATMLHDAFSRSDAAKFNVATRRIFDTTRAMVNRAEMIQRMFNEGMTRIGQFLERGRTVPEAIRRAMDDGNWFNRVMHPEIGVPKLINELNAIMQDAADVTPIGIAKLLAKYADGLEAPDVTLSVDHFMREIMMIFNSPDFIEVRVILPGDPDFARGASNGSRWDGIPRLAAVTRPITINDQDGDPVEFPPWHLEFALGDKLKELRHGENCELLHVMRLSVAAGYAPNIRRDGDLWHPHVRPGGNVCGGTANAPGRRAITSGQISDAFFVFFQLLCSYNHEGDFNDLRHWSPRKIRCSACQGRVKPGEQHVTVDAPNGTHTIIHKTCATEYEGKYYHPAVMYKCPVCQKTGPKGAIRRDVGGMNCCVACHDRYAAEVAAANSGEFKCVRCGVQHGREVAKQVQVPIRNGWVFCSSCTEPTETLGEAGEKLMRFKDTGELVSPLDPRFRPTRPTPRVQEVERCDCGAWQPKGTVRGDFFRVAKVCPTCDPEELQLSAAFLRDIGYLEGWIQNFWALLLDEFTAEYVAPLSFLAARIPVEEAAAVVKRLRQVELGNLNLPPALRMPLREYCAAMNALTEAVSRQPLLTITANTEEEHVYNDTIARRNGNGGNRNPEQPAVDTADEPEPAADDDDDGDGDDRPDDRFDQGT